MTKSSDGGFAVAYFEWVRIRQVLTDGYAKTEAGCFPTGAMIRN